MRRQHRSNMQNNRRAMSVSIAHSDNFQLSLQRELIWLRHTKSLRFCDIACQFKKSEVAVRQMYSRTLQQLRGIYNQIEGGVVYAGSYDGNIYALDATSGIKKWVYYTGAITSSPAVAGGMVYVGTL